MFSICFGVKDIFIKFSFKFPKALMVIKQNRRCIQSEKYFTKSEIPEI
jgi:hypothetical protein